jgi:hypothetical protein
MEDTLRLLTIVENVQLAVMWKIDLSCGCTPDENEH